MLIFRPYKGYNGAEELPDENTIGTSVNADWCDRKQLSRGNKFSDDGFDRTILYTSTHMKPPTSFAFRIILVFLVSTVSYGTITYQELIQNSANFANTFRAFPVPNNLISTLANYPEYFPQDSFIRQANGVRILIHRRIIGMMDAFLQHKRAHGSQVEKALYASMTRDQFIDRILQKRPLTFMNKVDTTLTRAPLQFFDSAQQQWFRVGTDYEAAPFQLKDYLSYDEMELSAFVSVATPTYFINDGNRKNKGEYGAKGSYQSEGIYIGAVGARFEVPGKMERKYLDVKRSRSNDPMFLKWENFYEISADQTIIPFDYNQIDPEDPNPDPNPPNINRHGYGVRMQMAYEPIILYANEVAKSQGKRARLRLVGLGLGVWAVNPVEQAKVIVSVVQEVIRNNELQHLGKIEFSWFPEGVLTSRQASDRLGNQIVLEQNRTNPAAPIDQGEMLVAIYAWDSNSFPGNEYWLDNLDETGDPAAACCSTIQELQNPYINTSLRAETKLVIYGNDKPQQAAGHHPQQLQAQQLSPPPAPANPPRAFQSGPSAPVIPPNPVPAASPNILPPRQPLASPNVGASPQSHPPGPSQLPPNQEAARPPAVPSGLSFEQLLQNSRNFEQWFHSLPVQTNNIQTLAQRYPKESFAKQAAGARIILHDRIFQMMQSFLLDKRSSGSAVEKKMYTNMTVHELIDRLLRKRPLMFTEHKDRTLLYGSGKTPIEAAQEQWFLVGTDKEQRPLVLDDYLSYDEMELSAFINVATPTYFINDGNRYNGGESGAPGSFHPEGIVIAAAGPRLDVPNRMEYKYLAEKRERKMTSSMFNLWEYVYQVTTNRDFIHAKQLPINRHGYKIRMKLTLEPILLYANDVAKSQGKTALLRLPGLGMGTWQPVEVELANVMVEVIADIIRENDLGHLGKIEFLWFTEAIHVPDSVIDSQDNEVVFEKTFISPAAPVIDSQDRQAALESSLGSPEALKEAEDSILLVTVYEWNGNSFPGNEYWNGEFEASRSAVMACCSTIQELQNPFINTELRASTRLVLYGAEKPKAPAAPRKASMAAQSPLPAPQLPTTPPPPLPSQAASSSSSSSSQSPAPQAYQPPPSVPAPSPFPIAGPSRASPFSPNQVNPPSHALNVPLLNPQQLQYNADLFPNVNRPLLNVQQQQFPNPQPSYYSAQQQYPNPVPLYHNAQAPNPQPAQHNAQQFPSPQPGSYHNAQQQFPNPQPSYHNVQAQFPNPQPSYNHAQAQFPSPQPSYHNAQQQFPNPHQAYHNPQQHQQQQFPNPHQAYHNPQQYQQQQQQQFQNPRQAYHNPQQYQQHQFPNPQNQQHYYQH